MAKVKFDFRDLDDDLIPEVCAKCGAGATVQKSKLFSWQPGWVWILILFGLLPFLVVALILTKRRTVSLPFCEAHKNHWSWRTLATLSSFALVAVVGGAAIVLLMNSDPGAAGNQVGGVLCLASILLLVAWLIAAAIIQNTAIQAVEITDYSITLRNVAGDFAAACEEKREDGDRRGVDRIARDEWRRPRDADDKIRRPKPPGPPTDAYEPG